MNLTTLTFIYMVRHSNETESVCRFRLPPTTKYERAQASGAKAKRITIAEKNNNNVCEWNKKYLQQKKMNLRYVYKTN